jgi:hypothetical protein
MRDETPVQWNMPKWASDILMETLEMDSESSSFDPDLRREISEALSTVSTMQAVQNSGEAQCTP